MTDPVVLDSTGTGPDSMTVNLALPADHPAFDGHFPGRPILAGVVQIDWAIRLAETYLGTASPTTQDFQVKFRRVIGPDAPVSLDLRLDRDRRVLEFSYQQDDAVASSGRIWLAPPV